MLSSGPAMSPDSTGKRRRTSASASASKELRAEERQILEAELAAGGSRRLRTRDGKPSKRFEEEEFVTEDTPPKPTAVVPVRTRSSRAASAAVPLVTAAAAAPLPSAMSAPPAVAVRAVAKRKSTGSSAASSVKAVVVPEVKTEPVSLDSTPPPAAPPVASGSAPIPKKEEDVAEMLLAIGSPSSARCTPSGNRSGRSSSARRGLTDPLWPESYDHYKMALGLTDDPLIAPASTTGASLAAHAAAIAAESLRATPPAAAPPALPVPTPTPPPPPAVAAPVIESEVPAGRRGRRAASAGAAKAVQALVDSDSDDDDDGDDDSDGDDPEDNVDLLMDFASRDADSPVAKSRARPKRAAAQRSRPYSDGIDSSPPRERSSSGAGKGGSRAAQCEWLAEKIRPLTTRDVDSLLNAIIAFGTERWEDVSRFMLRSFLEQNPHHAAAHHHHTRASAPAPVPPRPPVPPPGPVPLPPGGPGAIRPPGGPLGPGVPHPPGAPVPAVAGPSGVGAQLAPVPGATLAVPGAAASSAPRAPSPAVGAAPSDHPGTAPPHPPVPVGGPSQPLPSAPAGPSAPPSGGGGPAHPPQAPQPVAPHPPPGAVSGAVPAGQAGAHGPMVPAPMMGPPAGQGLVVHAAAGGNPMMAAALASDPVLARKVEPETLKRVWENLEVASKTYQEKELPEEVVSLVCRVTAVLEKRPQSKSWVNNLILRQARLGS